jgi:ribosomal protein S18 acetylase RimI-like enzyme
MLEIREVVINAESFPAILAVYESVEWAAYTNDESKLKRGLKNSHRVWGAYDDDDLIGILRTISDGETIVYLQDILVRPDRQRLGIGTQLMLKFLTEYEDFRQKVLLTDNTEAQRSFYESMGFTLVGENLNAYYRFD